MISRVQVSKEEVVAYDKKDNSKPFIDHVFFGHEKQGRCLYICAPQSGGKTTLCLNLVKRLCKPHKSQVFVFTHIKGLDQKVEKQLSPYFTQYFDEEQMEQGAISQLFEYMKENELENNPKGKKYNYIRYFVLFDDVNMPKSVRKQLIYLLRCYRHFNEGLMVCMSTQEFLLVQEKQARNLYNAQALGGGITNDRLKQQVYPQLRCELSYEDFYDIYKDATSQEHSFLIIDNRGTHSVFQKNLNNLYMIQ